MKRTLALAAVLLAPLFVSNGASGQGRPRPRALDRAQQEILRRGDLVEHIFPGAIEDARERAFTQVMAPPADDSHKWFISVVTMQGCGACERLKADWSRSPELLAFANPRDARGSWAHLNWFGREDGTQQFRWASIRLESFPAIIIQPPLNAKYGNPKTVVAHITGYNGDAKAFAEDLRSRFRFYLEELQERREGEAIERERKKAIEQESKPAPVGVDPPFVVPTPVDPLNPGPLGPMPPSPNDAPPRPSSDPSLGLIVSLIVKLITTWASGGSLSSLMQTAALLAITVMQYLKLKKLTPTAPPAPAS
jgi:hypothetical protein